MIGEKLMRIQTEIKAPKNLYNSFGKYNYRNAEGICEAVKPYLKKENVSLVLEDDIVAVGGRVYVKATATLTDNESNETVTASAYAREAEEKKGMDDSQITGTASSYARKYALNGLLLLDDTKDADSDEYKNEEKAKAAQKKDDVEKQVISDTKTAALLNKCEAEGVLVDVILKLYKVPNLESLTEKQFSNINEHWNEIKAVK